ncbi:unnamed protein product [Cylindrotheca closterium]|uniref:Uncharacterized protein n=1 Tax=Cylindrotheca closterium TaxID=2856 RepID=A0AAD2FPC9_9STRA|nr:unnamed protein product [Cylindrotheca closterium]
MRLLIPASPQVVLSCLSRGTSGYPKSSPIRPVPTTVDALGCHPDHPVQPQFLTFPWEEATSLKKAAIRTKHLSEEMKACKLTQMDLTGLPHTNAQFLCATINYEWDGDTSDDGSIEKCFTEEMVTVLSMMAMDNAEDDLVILPVSELRARDKKLWLTSKDKVEELTYKNLKPYVDWSWNNGANNNKSDALIVLKLSQVSRLPLTAVMAIYHTELC